jgi:hypothetical protein
MTISSPLPKGLVMDSLPVAVTTAGLAVLIIAYGFLVAA